MSQGDLLEELRADLDYEKLIQNASPVLQLYIRTLEQENGRLRQELLELRQSADRRQRAAAARQSSAKPVAATVESVRHPEDVMVISITEQGFCKRTPLNDYSTQRRGGVGVFDIQTARDDQATRLLVTRASASLIILTDRGRAFRTPVETLPLTEVRGRGTSLPDRLMLASGEALSAVLALDEERESRSNVLIATSRGWVRTLHRNYVGPRLQPGTLLYEPKQSGPAVAMTLSHGAGDVLIALRSGVGIRFSERLVRRDGVRGIQVRPDDAVVGLSSVTDDAVVLLLTADGKGTRRQMDNFRANKSPGAQGKILMKTDALVGATAVAEGDEVLCLSGFAKVIRFAVDEAPAKTGSVQGVSVMDCRGDALTAFAIVSAP